MLSAKGFALGYIGSVILLVLNLLMIQFPSYFMLPNDGMAARFSFLITGLWWAGFSQITFRVLPHNPFGKDIKKEFLLKGYQEIIKVWNEVKQIKVMNRFLTSFFFYSMGVQTVMYLAATFGDNLDYPVIS